MASEYVAGTYANGGTFSGYFDIDFNALTATGSINALGREFTPGRQLNTNNYFEDTTFLLEHNSSGGYDLLIKVTNSAAGGSRTFYDLSFSQSSAGATQFDSGAYRSTTVRTFQPNPDVTETTIASSAISSTPIPVCFVTGTQIRTARGDVAVEKLQIGD